MLRAIVLGAGAGGGFPQWNSAGPGCRRARAGDQAAKPRSQASLAVSADGERWLLLNASPDLRAQMAATPALHPRPAPLRNSPIATIALTGAEVDTIAGLLNLRERQPFRLYGAPQSLDVLAANPIFRALNPDFVTREVMPLNTPFTPKDGAGEALGLRIEAYPVPGKVPLFAEAGHDPSQMPALLEDGEAVGLAISAGGAVLHYIPGCAMMTPALAGRLRGAACVMFDGTLYTDDEMITAGAGPKTGQRMGHMCMTQTMAAFAPLGVARRIFIHINNTNPALLDDSPERATLTAAGWEVAEDGMEISL